MSQATLTLATATSIIETLAEAYGLDHKIVPLTEADHDVQRALSDVAPMVSETAPRRWYAIERATLRTYVGPISNALSPVNGIVAMSDPELYDTRAGASAEFTCFAFCIDPGRDEPDQALPDYAVLLSARPAELAAIQELVDRPGPVDVRHGVRPETMRQVFDANTERERVAFARSRELYATEHHLSVT